VTLEQIERFHEMTIAINDCIAHRPTLKKTLCHSCTRLPCHAGEWQNKIIPGITWQLGPSYGDMVRPRHLGVWLNHEQKWQGRTTAVLRSHLGLSPAEIASIFPYRPPDTVNTAWLVAV
jgi:hypothetical protein